MIYEKHDAIVTNIDDPDKEGKIQVACVGILGDEDSPLPMWIEPNFDWGWFYIPDVGETVEIEIVIGTGTDEVRGQTSLDTPDVTWRGKRRWTSEEVDGQNVARPIPETFLENYGKRRGLVTPTGHTILFDDTEGKERLELIWSNAKDKNQSILLDETGSIKITDAEGQYVHIDAENKKIETADANGNTVTMEDGLVKVVAASSVEVEAATATVKADSVSVDSSDVKVGTGADATIMRADDFIIHMDTHTHATAFGPSGPPLVPTPPNVKSTTSKVK